MIWIHTTYCDFLQLRILTHNIRRLLRRFETGVKGAIGCGSFFPQLKGLGHSYNADYYGIAGADEARAYRQHPVLRERLREITEALLLLDGLSAKQIFGDVDAMKLRSSMTLFWEATREGLFRKVLDKYYEGKMCDKTLGML